LQGERHRIDGVNMMDPAREQISRAAAQRKETAQILDL
jgi:hypothetical protein